MPISSLEVMRGSILCYEGKVQKVKTVGEYIMFEGWREWVGPSLINGEPISEEWLKRLGLNLIQEGSMSHPAIYRKEYSHRLVISNFDVSVRGANEFYWAEGNTIIKLQYVHQLQLIAFAIIGHHLIIHKLK